MKTILLLSILAVTVLIGCAEPTPMNRGTQQSFDECTKKNWVPSYFSNGYKTEFSCDPIRPPIPMNEHTSRAFKACLDKDKVAIYDAPRARVICLEEGAKIRLQD